MDYSNPTDRQAEVQRIQSLQARLSAFAAVDLDKRILSAHTACDIARRRYGEAALLHSLGELSDEAVAAIRANRARAQEDLLSLQLQANSVQALRSRLSDDLSSLTADDRAADREQRRQRYAKAREDFDRDFPMMSDADIIKNGAALFDMACAVGRGREIKDHFHDLRHGRGGALLQRFV